MKQQKLKRSYIEYPRDWQRIEAAGLGWFVTHEVHQLPDGSRHVWDSRRHRKRRGGQTERDERLTPVGGHRHYRWWGWEPSRPQWWIAMIFTVGSVLLVIGGLHPFFPNGIVHAVTFSVAGSTCFTVANYVAILEIINAPPSVAALPNPTAGESVDATSARSWRWWGWMPERIDYLATFLMFVGGLLFKFCFIFGIMKTLNWHQIDVLIWLPSLLGSLCFVVGSWLDLAEVNHGIWGFRPKSIDWWSCVTCLLGSMGYGVSSLFGFFGQGPILIEQTWGNYVAVWVGSVMFLISSYLMIPEALDHVMD